MCAVLYLLFQKTVNCLYITAESLVYHPTFVSYFKAFAEKHNSCIKSYDEILQYIQSRDDFVHGVDALINNFEGELYLFTDLSVFKSQNDEQLKSLLMILLTCKKGLRVVVWYRAY